MDQEGDIHEWGDDYENLDSEDQENIVRA